MSRKIVPDESVERVEALLSQPTTPRARRVLGLDGDLSALTTSNTVIGSGAQGFVFAGEVNLGDAVKAVVLKDGTAKEAEIMCHLSSGEDDKAATRVVSLLHAAEPDDRGIRKLTISSCELGSLAGQPLSALDEASRNLYILQIFNDVAQGLKYMHKKQVMHLDLKPENIFLDQQGRACIGDFGHAERNPKACTEDATEMKSKGRVLGVGTPYYGSPETVMSMMEDDPDGVMVDYKSDLWSLGAMLGKFIKHEVALVDYETLQDVAGGPAGPMAQTLKLMRAAEARVTGDGYRGWAADSRLAKRIIEDLVKAAKSKDIHQLTPTQIPIVLNHLSKWMTAPIEQRPNSIELADVLETIQSLVPKVQITDVAVNADTGKPEIAAVKQVVRSSPAVAGMFAPSSRSSGGREPLPELEPGAVAVARSPSPPS